MRVIFVTVVFSLCVTTLARSVLEPAVLPVAPETNGLCAATECAAGLICELRPKPDCKVKNCELFATCVAKAGKDVVASSNSTECPANSEFLECGSPCEPTCDKPEPGICLTICEAKCQCKSGFFRNSKKQCVPKAQCKSQVVTCLNVECPLNMICDIVDLTCEDGVCPQEAVCIDIDEFGISSPSCSDADCEEGFQCEMVDLPCDDPDTLSCSQEPICVEHAPALQPRLRRQTRPRQGLLTCSTLTCRPGFHCVNSEIMCVKAPCPEANAKCLPNVDGPLVTCETLRCAEGTRCEQPAIACLVAPCPQSNAHCVLENAPNPCAATSCPVGSTCEVQEVQCIRAPCPPIGVCRAAPTSSNCSANEFFDSCTGCENTCEVRNSVCPAICRSPGRCRCNVGFFRNNAGLCVPESECDAEGGTNCTKENEVFNSCGSACAPSCDNPTPEHCTMQCVIGCQCAVGFVRDWSGYCIKQEQCNDRPSCRTVKCTADTTCVMEDVICKKEPCLKQPRCVPSNSPTSHPCQVTDCQSGFECVEETVQCLVAPCHPVAKCIPKTGASCETVRLKCSADHQCGMVNGSPTCVPVDSSLSHPCQRTECKSGLVCVEESVQCLVAPCYPVPKCVKPSGATCETVRLKCSADHQCGMVDGKPTCVPVDTSASHPCQVTDCQSGFLCIEEVVQCVKAPCYPVAKCVLQSGATCATVRLDCKEGYQCGIVNGAPTCVPGKVPVNGTSCPVGESWAACGRSCEPMCGDEAASRMCTQECQPSRCECNEGLARHPNGTCVPRTQCLNQTCPIGEKWTECASSCESICNDELMDRMCTEQCLPAKCQCDAAAGYARNPSGVCVKRSECPALGSNNCSTGEIWKECASSCEALCGDELMDRACTMNCLPAQCQCDSASGYARNTAGVCVKRDQCSNGNTSCPVGENWMNCSNSCEPFCGDEAVKRACTKDCGVPKCQCTGDLVRSSAGSCVARAQCPGKGIPNECAIGEIWRDCSSACEPKCGDELAGVCPAACGPPKCECNGESGFARGPNGTCIQRKQCPDINAVNPCASTSCPVGTTCEIKEVQCIRAPCNPIAVCRALNSSDNCSPNEVFDKCGGCDGTCENKNPVCTLSCKPAACRCATGFLRNSLGQCVTESECEVFIIVIISAPTLPTLTCANILCDTNNTCQMVQGNCTKKGCSETPQCLPNDISTCNNVKCTANQSCKMVQVQCFTTPCHPQPQCLNTTTETTCKKGEKWTECSSSCEATCGDEVLDRICPAACGSPMCQCSDGYARNTTGVCVLRNKCNNSTGGATCDTVRIKCSEGQQCGIVNGAPTCVAVNGTRPGEQCPVGEAWMNCSSSCEAACGDELISKMCTLDCGPPACQCKQGYARNSNKTCVLRERCSDHVCPVNQQWSECGPTCEEECSSGNNTKPCIASKMCAPPRCTCKAGFLRNSKMDCVQKTACNQTVLNCDSIPLYCAPGFECGLVGVVPKCIPINGSNVTCENVRLKCTAGQTCGIVNGQPTCVPSMEDCFLIDCLNGTRCEINSKGKASCVSNGAPLSDCSLVDCLNGTRCEINSKGKASCVPNGGSNVTCANVRLKCSAGQTCGMVKGHPTCVSAPSSDCSLIDCRNGTRCVMNNNGKASCVPNGADPSNPPSHRCSSTEVWKQCNAGCEPTCDKPNKACSKTCHLSKAEGGCVCAPGLVRDSNSHCVPYHKCPKKPENNSTCGPNEMETDCMPQCEETCRGIQKCAAKVSATVCRKGCVCHAFYKRNQFGRCTHESECHKRAGCKKHEEWDTCMPCEKKCGVKNVASCSLTCFAGCACSTGYSRDKKGECIPEKKCPYKAKG